MRRNCFGVLIVFLCVTVGAFGQWKAKDTEWPTYGADLAGSKYRPLDQINAANFNKLEIAWRFKTESLGNRPESPEPVREPLSHVHRPVPNLQCEFAA